MEPFDDFNIPDTPALNNAVLSEINANLKDIRVLLRQISDQQEAIKVRDLNITLGSMIGLVFKWVVATMIVSLVVFFIFLLITGFSLGQLLSFGSF